MEHKLVFFLVQFHTNAGVHCSGSRIISHLDFLELDVLKMERG